jgi:predicted transcriptional regulator
MRVYKKPHKSPNKKTKSPIKAQLSHKKAQTNLKKLNKQEIKEKTRGQDNWKLTP